ncbi:N-acetylornithine carbamoyltransferase [Zunongwangia profunda]|jgi:N-succinyl-L-ornithine transcarbamylase|uniref:N-succinylornithine carbamoyltransferase n=2 Tax=Zunongwangia profunda TaxID=398743 RepID=D5BG00_ZUNPS|nr:N-acetylornithine carbamoyltransferase [Zunongwangia profunda]ADF53113.1 N-acetylornithine carbamoyltransferase [Zunongwangia profunda SM-A87]MAS69402.1 acetylornithine carbamoyltransferase [Zunongwangia sp.]MCC4227783.1 N-acetylornithine carbamoyltransferase [Zunongwangia profunda]HCV83146.1 N-acetylornithine carbamoyltransferase [Zunongwangia profunda]|tara:strand:- start:145 stop:1092 length:948 start_codon:yes stop_codon:yes gene_type:complete
MKHYTSVHDIENLDELIQEAIQLKKENSAATLGKGKTLGLLFFNSSLRTRLSTEKAGRLLGMEVLTMNVGADGWALEFEDGAVMNSDKAEHIKEAAAVLSQYCDVIGVRAFPGLKDKVKDEEEQVINAFKKYASVPVVNLESSTGHPLQALTDAISITELKKKDKLKVVLTWAPHPKALPQSVPNSFAEMMQKMDVDFCVANPEGYDLSNRVLNDTKVYHNQDEALKDADFVYVKNWSSYEKYGEVLSTDSNWTFSKEKLALTNDAKVMHCLPVRRNVVISDEVLDSENSAVIHQANNRTYAAQAVLKRILEKLD